jgi:peptidoglycan/LPS O-acetylase OafA/YrhL
MKKGIEAIDGLRTIAVLGVIWTHIWMSFDNIPWKIGSIDVNRIISFGRNGVDLFFVISGFCMYFMYGSKVDIFGIDNYKTFLVKRWTRIAPAFYFLIVVESLLFLYHIGVFPYQSFFYHLFFINIFLPVNPFSPHYWSLATEWHFYLVFPFLFIRNKEHKQLVFRIMILILICLIFRLVLFHEHSEDLVNKITIDSSAIWYRFVEFGFGIIVGKFYLSGVALPKAFRGLPGLALAFAIAYLGRICMLTEFVNLFGKYAFIVRAFGEPVMTFGFALILYNVITTKTIVSRLISSKPFLFIGKISYSMYLWHLLIAGWISRWIIHIIGESLFSFNLAIIVSLIVVIPLSWLSFKLLEEPYFRKYRVEKKQAYVEVF